MACSKRLVQTHFSWNAWAIAKLGGLAKYLNNRVDLVRGNVQGLEVAGERHRAATLRLEAEPPLAPPFGLLQHPGHHLRMLLQPEVQVRRAALDIGILLDVPHF